MDIPFTALENSIAIGDVFLTSFDDIDHQKFVIITGISEGRVSICTVFINSNINPYKFNKENLLKLQIPILKSDYAFLSHDSFVDCASHRILDFTKITTELSHGQCKIVCSLNSDFIETIRRTLVTSGTLTIKEEKMFFSDILPNEGII